MKNKGTVIRDKIDSLDTLSSGIVYGKEDAWGKLQVRMDEKAVKRMPLMYWMAAAVVLITVFISGFYFYPAKRIVSSKGNETIHGKDKSIASAPSFTDGKQAETAFADKPISTNKRNKKRKDIPVIYRPVHKSAFTVTDIPEPVTINTVVINAASAMPVKMPMKVVQINDLENGIPAPVSVERAVTPPVIAKMRVIHINELGDDRWQRKMDEFVIKYENSIALSKQVYIRQ